MYFAFRMTRRQARCRVMMFAAAWMVLAGAVASVHAADRFWAFGRDGEWFDQFNWRTSPQADPPASVPGSGDFAVFDIGGVGYKVSFPADVLVNAVQVFNDPVIFDLGSHQLTTKTRTQLNFVIGGTVHIGADPGDAGVLTLRKGRLTTPSAHVGLGAGPGTLVVEETADLLVPGLQQNFGTIKPFSVGGLFFPETDFDPPTGESGEGTLDLRGKINVTDADSYIGAWIRSVGRATVDSGTWTTEGSLVLGHDGGTGDLLIVGGGEVTVGEDTIVGETGRTNEFVNVNGRGEVDVAGGSLSTSGNAVIGLAGNASGDVVLTGGSSMWGILGNLEVARFGKGNLLVRQDANLVVLGDTSIGSKVGAIDGLITVTGDGSVFTTPGAVYVGGSSSGAGGPGGLRVLAGAAADMSGLTVWNTGSLRIDGGQLLSTGSVKMANGSSFSFPAGKLIVEGGTFTRAGTLSLGGTNAADPPTLRLGVGASSALSADLNIAAFSGAFADVEVSGASSLSVSDDLFVGGSEFNAQGNGSLTIATNSEVSAGDLLQVWPGGVMAIDNGGAFAADLRIAGGELSMTGAGSTLQIDAVGGSAPITGIHLGLSGPASRMEIDGGGALLASGVALNVGSDTGSQATATVVDAGSLLHTGSARIGNGGDGTLIVRQQGKARFDGDMVLASGPSASSLVNVQGSGSELRCNGRATVGRFGQATLQVGTGASLHTLSDTMLGTDIGVAGPSSGFVALSGGGQWTNDGSIYVGGDAVGPQGDGRLQLQTGATLKNAGELRVWPTGILTMFGGELHTGDLLLDCPTAEECATLELLGGTVRVDGGQYRFTTSLTFGGTDPNNPVNLEFVNGADAQVQFAWHIGRNPGTHGATTVRGVSTAATAGTRRSTLLGTGGGGGADLIVGREGTGIMHVLDGALVDFGDDVVIGSQDNAVGELHVEGLSGALRATVRATRGDSTSRAIIVGGGQGSDTVGGNGSLTVRGGGLVETSGTMAVARNPGAVGHVDIGGSADGLGEIRVGTDLFLAGGASGPGGDNGEILVRRDGLLVVNGTLKVWENGFVDMDEGTLRANHIDLTDSRPGFFNFFLGRVEANQISGSFVNGSGTLAPGSSPAAVTIHGNYEQFSGGTLEIEIFGERPEERDVLHVTGTATLGGTLHVIVDPAVEPADGDALTILTHGTRVGEFADVIVDGAEAFHLRYADSGVEFVFGEIPVVPGDLDGDGDADLGDYALFESCLSGPAPEGLLSICQPADFDGDDAVTVSDFSFFQRQYDPVP